MQQRVVRLEQEKALALRNRELEHAMILQGHVDGLWDGLKLLERVLTRHQEQEEGATPLP